MAVVYKLAGRDVVNGGQKEDVAEDKNTINLNGGSDEYKGGAGTDIVHGGNGSDTIYGGDGHNELHGDAGNDYQLLSYAFQSASLNFSFGGAYPNTLSPA